MKKFSACTILSVSAFCSLLSLNSLKVYADTTMTVKLVSTGNQISGSSPQVYVFPYYFSFNGSTDLTPLMCISYKNEITVGETWTATMVPVSGNEQYVEAAYIEALAAAPGASANTIAVAQWANWEFFDPEYTTDGLSANLPAGYQTQIDAMLDEALKFAENNTKTTDYPYIDIFIPKYGWPAGDGIPQYFVGDPYPDPAPEPSSLILLGSGLLGLAGTLYRKRCFA